MSVDLEMALYIAIDLAKQAASPDSKTHQDAISTLEEFTRLIWVNQDQPLHANGRARIAPASHPAGLALADAGKAEGPPRQPR